MPPTPFSVLERKRRGTALGEKEIRALVAGTVDGSWSEAQLAAFLMAAMIQGLDASETRALTLAMLESGERWALARDVPRLGDKHSTGGVGDKVSLVLSPLLAACGQPVVMLTGRGLGHTGGTADKLEVIPGLDLALDRARALELLGDVGMAIGVATDAIAPADRVLYRLRDQTATVESIALITASILSKKLATGAAGIAFDVKTGSGAFMREPRAARELARSLVETAGALGCAASAWVTDMSQPLGDWVGHAAEVGETVACLEGRGPANLMEIVYTLSEEVAQLTGSGLRRADLEAAIGDGRARAKLDEWVAAQGGDPGRIAEAAGELAPHQAAIEAPSGGVLAAVDAKALGLLLAEAGGGRVRPGGTLDTGVSLHYRARLGARLEAGDEIARLYLRRPDESLVERARACFMLAPEVFEPPPLLRERIG